MCTINHRMYGSWDIKCPLTSSQPKQSKFWNNNNKKNTWRYYHLHLCNTNDDHDVWFLRYEARQTGFFVILGYFLPFYPPNNPENQTFEKMKKNPGDIILHKCTINDNHMINGSWDINCNRQIFFGRLGPFFALLPPLTAQKIKISKKWKKHQEIWSFYTTVPKIMIIGYTVPEMWHVTDVIVIFHFGLFFALLSP